MKFQLEETVITYPKQLLDDWKAGDKSWIPDELFVPDEIYNQTSFHFGEYFTLKTFIDAGWSGTAYYALGDWEPTNAKYDEGRALVAKLINPKRLALLKTLRKGLSSGEPDLMLYKDDGTVLFIEVKKESDKLSDTQIICLSQIKSILGCDVAVVYLAEETKTYQPKTHELDLVELPRNWLA